MGVLANLTGTLWFSTMFHDQHYSSAPRSAMRAHKLAERVWLVTNTVEQLAGVYIHCCWHTRLHTGSRGVQYVYIYVRVYVCIYTGFCKDVLTRHLHIPSLQGCLLSLYNREWFTEHWLLPPAQDCHSCCIEAHRPFCTWDRSLV